VDKFLGFLSTAGFDDFFLAEDLLRGWSLAQFRLLFFLFFLTGTIAKKIKIHEMMILELGIENGKMP